MSMEIFLESIKSNISKMYYFWLFELMDELRYNAIQILVGFAVGNTETKWPTCLLVYTGNDLNNYIR